MHEHRDLRHVCDEGRAGDNAGILLRGANREDVERGQVLAAPGTTRASIELRKPIAMEVGRRFALREGNKTVDAGKVLTVHA